MHLVTTFSRDKNLGVEGEKSGGFFAKEADQEKERRFLKQSTRCFLSVFLLLLRLAKLNRWVTRFVCFSLQKEVVLAPLPSLF